MQIKRADKTIDTFISNKVPALLAYLAVTRRAHSRDKLAALLWGEMSDTDAKNNLRQALANLKKFFDDELTIARDSIEFTGDGFVDSVEFESALRSASSLDAQPASVILTDSLCLYRGDFLEGFHVRDAPDFENWMLTERARLRELALQALHRLAEIELSRANYPAALEATSRLLAFDPWREEAHRQRMSALARAGQRSAALAQYQSCRRILEKELGVEPSAETTALYEQIRNAENLPLHNLPVSTTSFIGREAELAEIRVRLGNADCRLLSLVGEGGVGKSRLALQAAQGVIQQFINGVWFVPLAPVKDIEGMFLAIAGALKINVTGGKELQEFLRDKNLLLILDNLEQLIGDASLKWITDTIRAAPQVKILVTSIARLNIQAETLLEVRGLSFAETSSPAEKLFVERARQIKPDFNPSADDLAAIARLCELVDGAPLALELAAAWARGLSARDIVKEIERNLDILATAQQDLPPRHRSMRAVFDHFWNLLSPDEQIVFQKQAVFRGGFAREAFQEVTGADLSMLARFVDKSAIHFNENGRYRRHSLIVQYGTMRLRENAALYEQVRAAHAHYYSKFVKALEKEFIGGQPQKAMSPFLADLPNIRLAWEWAVEKRDAAMFNDMSDSFMQGFDLAGLYRDGRDLALKAIEALESVKSAAKEKQIAKGRVMGLAGAFLFRLGEYQQAMEWCEKSMQALKKSRPHIAYAHTLVYAGAAAFGLGDLEKVIAYWGQAVHEYRGAHSKWGDMVSTSNLAEALIAVGRLEEAKSSAEYSLTLAREMNNLEQIGGACTNLANWAIEAGQFDEATRYAEEALRSHQQIGHDAHIANSLAALAKIAFKQNDLEEARRLLDESIGILKRVGNGLYLKQREQELAEVASAPAK
ncbi:MAG: tetratricopeptide repeat protein [Anaerolineales bacterium]|nr:tetratricopeptide repeat protein [Anaerolineales bacterium]